MANFKIALSAGHGRYTAGKRCMKSLDPNETREWVLNARIADKVEKLLKEYIGYELLRLDDRTGAKDVALSARSSAANSWGADFYLAIHHNAGVNGSNSGGIVVYIYTKPYDESIEWQEALYDALIDSTGLKGNRKSPLMRANLHECRVPRMPSVLLELGFMDSSTDVPIILSETYADQCAAAIVKVIAERGKLTKRAGAQTHVPTMPIKVDYAKQYSKARKAGTYIVDSPDGVLNLRAGADASKALIEAMPTGSIVRCYGYYTDKWLYVKSERGNDGFCHSSYLRKV